MKEKVLAGIAWALLAVGISMADSECLLLPLMMFVGGALLLYKIYL